MLRPIVIGRPLLTEAAAYYFTYIDRVIGDDILGALAGQLEETLALCADVSEERSRYRYAEDKWSIRQVLNHITDSERVFAFRALWFARGFETALPSYDQNISVLGVEADRISWLAHVEEFRRVRLASIALFGNMPLDGWRRTGLASGNPFSVRALAYIIAGHLDHHVTLLLDRYLE
jgi:hypothetical protein